MKPAIDSSPDLENHGCVAEAPDDEDATPTEVILQRRQ